MARFFVAGALAILVPGGLVVLGYLIIRRLLAAKEE